jgi:predicted nucleotidyltransferase component of viral defense system
MLYFPSRAVGRTWCSKEARVLESVTWTIIVFLKIYDLQEVMAEKMRALIQRSYTAPRDYYDIWYLANNIPHWNWPDIVTAFHEKMKFKGLAFAGIGQLVNPQHDKAVKAAWTNSLGHQIALSGLPEYEMVKESLLSLFGKIF